MTQIKVDTVQNAAGTGNPDFADGLTYGGAATSTLNLCEYTSSGTEPSNPKNGSLWYDTANSKTNIYVNDAWYDVATVSASAWYGTRAVLGGGYSSNSDTNAIEYFDISTLGNGADFGDISAANRGMGGLSNGSIAVFGGGGAGTFINTMDKITTSTLGNSTDFGDLTVGRYGAMGTGDGTYGLFIGGITTGWSNVNTVDYITVASSGNATDFGDCIKSANNRAVGSNGTRAVAMCGEHSSSPYHTDDIDYFTIASPSNATDFGNMTAARAGVIGNLDDGTYACCAGGYSYSSSARVDTIDYITLATTGNATDFGDLLAADNVGRGVNNGSRGCVCGDYNQSNTIQYITISSPANAQDFGDLNAGRYECGAASGSAS